MNSWNKAPDSDFKLVRERPEVKRELAGGVEKGWAASAQCQPPPQDSSSDQSLK